MNSSQFKKSQFKLFCANIGFSPKKVEYIIDNIDSYYSEWFEKKPDKKNGGFKTYKDGTVKIRTIRPSLKELKIIQKNIKDRILTPIKLPSHIHGGVKKRSNISNAKPHQGNKYQFTTDLQAFYPSIKFDRIFDTFLKLGFSNHYSHWLTKITTWKYELPQGTPTSTHLSNLVFLETDFKLIDFCNKNKIEYTRYVDDLTFSSQNCFKHLLNDILEIVTESGFKISYRKTKYAGNQNITGIDVFNNFIDAPDKILMKSKEETIKEFKPYTNYLNNIRKTNKRKPTLNSHRHCQAAQATRTSQSLSKSVSEPTHGRQKRKHDCTTMAMRNAGESADMKVITFNKLSAKLKGNCLEIPHYVYCAKNQPRQ